MCVRLVQADIQVCTVQTTVCSHETDRGFGAGLPIIPWFMYAGSTSRPSAAKR